jgi:hypothetical protein
MRQLDDIPVLISNLSAATSGMAMNSQGALHRLSQAEWLKARDDLEKLRGNQELP